jgi:uncharacterized small protein (DUF1192 family)
MCSCAFLGGPAACDNRRRRGYFGGRKGRAAMAMNDEELPKKKIAHEIGQDLYLLSVEDLAERIALLKQEIGRLDAAMGKAQASRSAADQFFKK